MIRYPGVSPFKAEQKNIFFGRDNDIDRLKKLILLRKQVLLYSKSGIGKTSLLNAGVLPHLEDKFLLVKIRFHAYTKENPVNPLSRIIDAINEAIPNFSDFNNTILDKIIDNKSFEPSLWWYFKKIQLANTKKQSILVFDQFEEIFSYPDEYIKQFKNEFYELTSVDIPDTVMQMISEKPEIEDDERIDELYEAMNTKTVFAIRSDRLSLLNKLSDKIPDIQKVFYELKALDKEQTRQAIINPAIDENTLYTIKAFTFSDEAINKIISSLTISDKGKQDIETTQLQIVCQQIESIAEAKAKQSLNKQKVEIQKKDLPEFKEIFLNFYQDSVKKTNEEAKARRFIEDQLIRSKQRVSLDAVVCKEYVTDSTLAVLVNTHLIRTERNNLGGFSYELSHDTLITPILESRKIHLEKQEEARAKAEQEEELRLANEKAEKERIEREKERKRQDEIIKLQEGKAIEAEKAIKLAQENVEVQKRAAKKQKTLLYVIAFVAVVSVASGVFAIVKMQETRQSTLNLWKKEAIFRFQQEEYEVALQKYIEMQTTLDYNTPAVQEKIIKCKQFDSISKLFYADLDKIDSLIKSKEIKDLQKTGVLFKQIKALNYEPGETKLQSRLKTHQLQIANVIKDRLRVAESMINAGLRNDAIKHIKEIELLDPDNKQITDFKKKHGL